MTTEYAGKKTAVIGMARTGLAAARALTDLGASVTLYDRKPASELADALREASELGAQVRPGADEVDLSNVDMLVPSPGVRRDAPSLAEAARRGIPVISEIELAYRISPAPIIAITGTNGKTTTTVLTGLMLRADGQDTFIAGNVVAGDIRMPLITAAAQAARDSVIVAEISTFQLEWIESFRPAIAALLNIGCDHQDRHASIEEYADLKASVFRNQGADDCSVANADQPMVIAHTRELRSRVLQFSRLIEPTEGAFVRGGDLIVRLGGEELRVCERADIRIPGEHNVENVLAASVMAAAYGVRPDAVLEVVRGFTGVEHRLEFLGKIDGVEYINNSMCTNVDAVVRSIEAIEPPVIVIAGGKDKGSDWAPFADVVKRRVKGLVLIGVSAPILERAVRDAGYAGVTTASDLEDAFDIARSLASPGDSVILAPGCASFDMFSGFEERGRLFKEIVRRCQDAAGQGGGVR